MGYFWVCSNLMIICLSREIESARALDATLPLKFWIKVLVSVLFILMLATFLLTFPLWWGDWIKTHFGIYQQHFAVGVNEVTRALERMPPNHGTKISSEEHFRTNVGDSEAPCVYLQVAGCVNPCFVSFGCLFPICCAYSDLCGSFLCSVRFVIRHA